MDSFSQFLFSAINFLILCALAYWLLGPAANHYFFSRRNKIRKHMLTAVMTLRQARARAAKSRDQYEGVPVDITARKKAIADNCERECKQIIDEATDAAEHMLKAGERRAAEERRRHASLIRERLMRSAFRMAEERIRKGATPEMQRRFMEKGLDRLSGMKVHSRDVPGSEPKGA